jgi:hypothetical protein
VIPKKQPVERREDARRILDAVTDVTDVAGGEKHVCVREVEDLSGLDMERDWLVAQPMRGINTIS